RQTHSPDSTTATPASATPAIASPFPEQPQQPPASAAGATAGVTCDVDSTTRSGSGSGGGVRRAGVFGFTASAGVVSSGFIPAGAGAGCCPELRRAASDRTGPGCERDSGRGVVRAFAGRDSF